MDRLECFDAGFAEGVELIMEEKKQKSRNYKGRKDV